MRNLLNDVNENKVDKKSTVDSFYGTSSTAAATTAKVITIADTGNNFSLRPGVTIAVKFSNANTANNPTFNVNNTGAKSVWYNTSVVSTESLWAGGSTIPTVYMYDGTNWVWMSKAIASSDTPAQSVNVNPKTTPTADGSIWIETT